MKSASAIMSFLNKGPEIRADLFYPTVSVSEVREFKSVCSEAEYHELARQACEILGEVFEPPQ